MNPGYDMRMMQKTYQVFTRENHAAHDIKVYLAVNLIFANKSFE